MEQKTIGASKGAYKVVMEKRQAMERESGEAVSMRVALDELLGVEGGE